MLGAEEPLREAEAVLRGVLRQRREEARRVEGDLVLLREVGAAVEDVRVTRHVVGHHHHARQDVATVAVEQHLGTVDLLHRGDLLPVLGEDVLVVMLAELLGLGRGALLLRREQGLELLGQHALVLRRFGEPGLEGLGLVDEEVLVQRVEVGLQLGEFGGLFRRGGLDDRGIEAEAAAAAGLRGAAARGAAFLHVIERVHPLVVVLLRDRVVFVVVALGAGDREAEPGGRGALDAVEEADVALLLGDVAAFAVEDVVTVEGRGDLLVECRVREQVAREHLGAELVERLVGVEGLHQPVAPDPLEGVAVLLEAVAVGVARGVEPRKRHAFAVVRGRHQAVDLLLIGVGARVGEEHGGLLGRGRQAGEVEREAAEQRGLGGFGRKREAGLGQLLDHEGVDGILLAVGGQGGADRRDERPVSFVLGAFGDPALEDLLLGSGDRAVGIRRGHDLLRVLGEEPLHQLARFGVAGHEGFFLQRHFTDIETELGLALVAVGAVAVEAVLRKDRAHVLVVVELGAEGGQGDDEHGEGEAEPGHGVILTGGARRGNGRG